MSKENHEKQLKDYISSKSTRIFSNSNRELYDLLIKVVFSTANSINWMVSNPEKTKSFLVGENFDIIKKYIESGKSLSLILIGNFDSIKSNYDNLKLNNSNFKFKLIDKKINVQDVFTWDNIGYRFTPDQHKLTGVACANDPEFTAKCNSIFNKINELI